ncbi:YadA-like family protein [Histophilus somni]|uniref:YadA-like family protein n=1 Tax=Histophilus somni TaxID=731 RepID=UPI00201F1FD6|nr:YadA-like family protein [Histophilus somni]
MNKIFKTKYDVTTGETKVVSELAKNCPAASGVSCASSVGVGQPKCGVFFGGMLGAFKVLPLALLISGVLSPLGYADSEVAAMPKVVEKEKTPAQREEELKNEIRKELRQELKSEIEKLQRNYERSVSSPLVFNTDVRSAGLHTLNYTPRIANPYNTNLKNSGGYNIKEFNYDTNLYNNLYIRHDWKDRKKKYAAKGREAMGYDQFSDRKEPGWNYIGTDRYSGATSDYGLYNDNGKSEYRWSAPNRGAIVLAPYEQVDKKDALDKFKNLENDDYNKKTFRVYVDGNRTRRNIVSIGVDSGTLADNTTLVGNQSYTFGGQAVVVGHKSGASHQAVSLGSDTYAYGNSSVAIGNDDLTVGGLNDTLPYETMEKIYKGLYTSPNIRTDEEYKKALEQNTPGVYYMPLDEYDKRPYAIVNTTMVDKEKFIDKYLHKRQYSPTASMGFASIAIGSRSVAYDTGTTAIGSLSYALGKYSTALGFRSYVDFAANSGMALGNESRVFAKNSIALGTNVESTNTGAMSYGYNAKAVGEGAIAIGHTVAANATLKNDVYTRLKSIYEGNDLLTRQATTQSSEDNKVSEKIDEINKYLEQKGSDFENKKNDEIFEYEKDTIITTTVDVKKAKKQGDNGLVIGRSSFALGDRALAIGTGVGAFSKNGMAMGDLSYIKKGADNSIAIGTGSMVTEKNATAIGYFSKANINNSMALGYKSVTDYTDEEFKMAAYTPKGSLSIPSSKNTGVFSIARKGAERRIINVAPGAIDTDAVNVSQLKALEDRLTINIDDEDVEYNELHYISIKPEKKEIDTRRIELKNKRYIKYKTELLKLDARDKYDSAGIDKSAGSPYKKLEAEVAKLKRELGTANNKAGKLDAINLEGKNLSQLSKEIDQAKEGSLADLKAYLKTVQDTDTNYNNKGAKTTGSVAVGYKVSVDPGNNKKSSNSVAIGSNLLVKGKENQVIGNNIKLGNNTNWSIIIGNNISTPDNEKIVESITLGDRSQSVTNAMSIGGFNEDNYSYRSRGIKFIKAGNVDDESTDAINGSQLKPVYDMLGITTETQKDEVIIIDRNSLSAEGKAEYEKWKKLAGNGSKNEQDYIRSLNGNENGKKIFKRGGKGGHVTATTPTFNLTSNGTYSGGNSIKSALEYLDSSIKAARPVYYTNGTKDSIGTKVPSTGNISNISFGKEFKVTEYPKGTNGEKYLLVELNEKEIQQNPALKGPKGDRGQKGAPGLAGKDGAPGKDGKSAYEIWSEKPENTKKTEEEFLKSLKGEKGQDGTNGQDGKSAYDIWKEKPENTKKTEEEFLKSLKGEKGQDGTNGQDGKSAYDIWKEKPENTKKTEEEFLKSLKGEKGQDGTNGQDGKSAYDIWKEKSENTEKTEEEFLKSLKGEKGQDGTNGQDGKSAYDIWKEKPENTKKTEEEFLKSLKGEKGQDGTNGQDGKSAYDIWKEKSENTEKTEEEFLKSLKGEKGEKGEAGKPGKDGAPGNTKKITGDSNIIVSDKGTTTNVSLNEDLKGINSIGRYKKEGVNKITFIGKNKGTSIGDNSLRNNVTISSNGGIFEFNRKGLHINDKKITGVADGALSADSTDAINGGQLVKATGAKLIDDPSSTSDSPKPKITVFADGKDGKSGREIDKEPMANKGLTSKDGLNGKNANDKANAIRDGEAGTVVFTDDKGNRLVKANDGKYYKKSEVNDDGTFKNETDGKNKPKPVEKPQLSLVNHEGNTTTPTVLGNVASGLGIEPYSKEAEEEISKLVDEVKSKANDVNTKAEQVSTKLDAVSTLADVIAAKQEAIKAEKSTIATLSEGEEKTKLQEALKVKEEALKKEKEKLVTAKNELEEAKEGLSKAKEGLSKAEEGLKANTDYSKKLESANVKVADLVKAGSEAKLTNVATVDDLQAVARAGINFEGNDGVVVHKNVGEKLTIKGEGEFNSATTAADNIKVTASDSGLEVKLSDTLKNMTSFETKETAEGNKSRLDGNGLTVTGKNNQSAHYGSEGITLTDGKNNVTLTSSSFTFNKGQAEKEIVIDGEKGEIRVPDLTSKSSPNAVANKRYVDALQTQTDQKFNHLENRFDAFSKESRAGIAGSNAAAALPTISIPGKSLLSVSAGTYKGQSAVAVGYSRVSDNGKIFLKVQGNSNSIGDFGGGVGIGWAW